MHCDTCSDRVPDLRDGNKKTMAFWDMAANCVRYISTMDNVMVAGIDWINLKAVAELSHIRITQPMMKRLRIIETLLIKESVENASKRNKVSG